MLRLNRLLDDRQVFEGQLATGPDDLQLAVLFGLQQALASAGLRLQAARMLRLNRLLRSRGERSLETANGANAVVPVMSFSLPELLALSAHDVVSGQAISLDSLGLSHALVLRFHGVVAERSLETANGANAVVPVMGFSLPELLALSAHDVVSSQAISLDSLGLSHALMLRLLDDRQVFEGQLAAGPNNLQLAVLLGLQQALASAGLRLQAAFVLRLDRLDRQVFEGQLAAGPNNLQLAVLLGLQQALASAGLRLQAAFVLRLNRSNRQILVGQLATRPNDLNLTILLGLQQRLAVASLRLQAAFVLRLDRSNIVRISFAAPLALAILEAAIGITDILKETFATHGAAICNFALNLASGIALRNRITHFLLLPLESPAMEHRAVVIRILAGAIVIATRGFLGVVGIASTDLFLSLAPLADAVNIGMTALAANRALVAQTDHLIVLAEGALSHGYTAHTDDQENGHQQSKKFFEHFVPFLLTYSSHDTQSYI